ncbi:hypothetical protein AB0D12_35855 [Streptomyces sp. NPDC048479]|uniref:hypothetical protein n=1 Tax=Streptomyces sp. NPDC048479 TaxID=3154725 RepID=UPI00341F4482
MRELFAALDLAKDSSIEPAKKWSRSRSSTAGRTLFPSHVRIAIACDNFSPT